jgi:hypothetical protein
MVVTFRALATGTAQVAFSNQTQVASSGHSGNTVDTMTPATVTVTSGGTPTPTQAPSQTQNPGQTQTPAQTQTPPPFSQAPALTPALAGGPALTLQPSRTSVAVGEQFTVTVSMDTRGHQVTAAEVRLGYPSARLQAVSVQPGGFLPSVLAAGAVAPGTASITVGSGTAPRQGIGSVATVTFRAVSPGAAQIVFSTGTQVSATGQAGNAVGATTPVTLTVLGAAGDVGAVPTGPVETGLMALIVAAIAVLAYVGYTGTEEFRRREAESIGEAARRGLPDFNR